MQSSLNHPTASEIENKNIEASNILPPEWFTDAIQKKGQDRYLESDQCKIHYLHWGKETNPGLVFIHGGGAHAHWWDFIAPFFQDQFSVAAVDLSGMGDSEWRKKYSEDLYGNEIMTVCRAISSKSKPIIVAHSMGGILAMKASLRFRQEFGGLILVDVSPHIMNAKDPKTDRTPVSDRQHSIYPNIETALTRFRLIPSTPCDNLFILNHIAKHSLIQTSEGWTWKFDPNLAYRLHLSEAPSKLNDLGCPTALIYGEKSSFFAGGLRDHHTKIFGDIPFISIPNAYHHLFLNEPLSFVDKVKETLKAWNVQ
jgi:pimeloyl-ACP methyl ester carboxylesterase